MNDETDQAKFFEKKAPGMLSELVNMGFSRRIDLEQSKETESTLVFCGTNIGFVFSYDVRDDCVDAQVVQVKDGRIRRTEHGGYSSNVFAHLVKYCGYRGGPSGVPMGVRSHAETSNRVASEISDWLNLLRTAGKQLLLDTPESLAKIYE